MCNCPYLKESQPPMCYCDNPYQYAIDSGCLVDSDWRLGELKVTIHDYMTAEQNLMRFDKIVDHFKGYWEEPEKVELE